MVGTTFYSAKIRHREGLGLGKTLEMQYETIHCCNNVTVENMIANFSWCLVFSLSFTETFCLFTKLWQILGIKTYYLSPVKMLWTAKWVSFVILLNRLKNLILLKGFERIKY